jgi:hypothetical protein
MRRVKKRRKEKRRDGKRREEKRSEGKRKEEKAIKEKAREVPPSSLGLPGSLLRPPTSYLSPRGFLPQQE